MTLTIFSAIFATAVWLSLGSGNINGNKSRCQLLRCKEKGRLFSSLEQEGEMRPRRRVLDSGARLAGSLV